MNTADLITSFFENEMSPDQERQFLLSVASSDNLRLGLKSHVMLDKIVQEEAVKTSVSTNIRASILKEAATVAAMAAAGRATAYGAEKEHAPVDAREEEETGVTAGTSGSAGLLASLPRWAAYPATILIAAGSFLFGFMLGDNDEGSFSPQQTTAVTEQTPVTEQPVMIEEPVSVTVSDVETESPAVAEKVGDLAATRVASQAKPTGTKKATHAGASADGEATGTTPNSSVGDLGKATFDQTQELTRSQMDSIERAKQGK